jgi:hypothetical protein
VPALLEGVGHGPQSDARRFGADLEALIAVITI